MTYHCHRCGADNPLVNFCGCDPDNLPTVPEYGTEDRCPQHEGGHEPDYSSVTLDHDGTGEIYVDVACRHCGRSGCVARLSLHDVDW